MNVSSASSHPSGHFPIQLGNGRRVENLNAEIKSRTLLLRSNRAAPRPSRALQSLQL